ncbi:MAG: acyl-CoA thioesterase [Alphaproteobacteria bacterium]|nr:acyl-CoA thioesterase [Alphaproteobacteria bacterium]
MHRSCTPADTRVEATHLVLPAHTNNHGTMFGGQVAAWMDISAAVAAQRFARKPVVTASIDELHFLRPVRRGMIVVLQAMVNQAWRTSMEVGVRVEAEDPRSGDRIHCCSAYLTFVALDATDRPSELPTLAPDGDPEWERRAREAQARRDHRLKMREERRAHR